MNISIAFAPLIPTALLWSALALVITLAIVVLFARTPGGRCGWPRSR